MFHLKPQKTLETRMCSVQNHVERICVPTLPIRTRLCSTTIINVFSAAVSRTKNTFHFWERCCTTTAFFHILKLSWSHTGAVTWQPWMRRWRPRSWWRPSHPNYVFCMHWEKKRCSRHDSNLKPLNSSWKPLNLALNRNFNKQKT